MGWLKLGLSDAVEAIRLSSTWNGEVRRRQKDQRRALGWMLALGRIATKKERKAFIAEHGKDALMLALDEWRKVQRRRVKDLLDRVN